MWRNLNIFHIWHVCDVENISTNVEFMLFFCKISFVAFYAFFVAESVLSKFMHFCVEKILTTNYACGENMTNMRYGKLHSFHFTLFSQKIQSCSLLLCFQAVTSLHSPCYTGQLRQVGRYRGIVISSPLLALWPNPNPLSISALWPSHLSFSYAIFWQKQSFMFTQKSLLRTECKNLTGQ